MTDRAAVERAREEKEMLEAEHKRQKAAHARYAQVWDQLAREAADEGSRAYAYERKHFYDYMLKATEAKWMAAKARGEKAVAAATASHTEVRLLERFEKTQRSEHYERRLDAAAKEVEEYAEEQRAAQKARAS